MRAIVLHLVALGFSTSLAAAQDMRGIGRYTQDSPFIPGVSASEGGFLEPEGISVALLVQNIGDKEIRAYELLIVALTPFNVVRTAETWTGVSRLEPGDRHTDHARYPYLGKRDIFTLVAIATKARFADGSLWVAHPDSIRASLEAEFAGLDLSAIPMPDGSFRLDGVPGAFSFVEMQLSPGWDGPFVEGACARYEASAHGGVALQLTTLVDEYLTSIPGDTLLVCGQVVHVIPAGTSSPGSVRGGG